MTYKQLAHNLKIIVPRYDNDHKELSHEYLTLRENVIRKYGGASVYTMVGSWENEYGVIMDDHNFMIEVYSADPFNPADVSRYARYILDECRQYAVSIIIDGVMTIFERE